MSKEMFELEKTKLWIGVAFVLVAGLLGGYFLHSNQAPVVTSQNPVDLIKSQSIEEQRTAWIDIADSIRGEQFLKAKYNCCLEKPCSYCIQDEGAECECLNDILAGEHPCGECIGEILEGKGLKSPEVVKLYAKAIAHKVGEQHTDHLKSIIADVYGMPVEQQA